MRISDWSSDVCSSDLAARPAAALRGGAVFAAESVVAGAYLQIDTVLVKLVLGDAAAGAYQAGLRFVVVGLVFAQSMGGIFIPALVARIGDPTAFAAAARRAVLAFAAYGAVCFAVLACFGQAIVLRLYGADYAATGALAPLDWQSTRLTYSHSCEYRMPSSAWKKKHTIYKHQHLETTESRSNT